MEIELETILRDLLYTSVPEHLQGEATKIKLLLERMESLRQLEDVDIMSPSEFKVLVSNNEINLDQMVEMYLHSYPMTNR